jgi:hypothetical protein
LSRLPKIRQQGVGFIFCTRFAAQTGCPPLFGFGHPHIRIRILDRPKVEIGISSRRKCDAAKRLTKFAKKGSPIAFVHELGIKGLSRGGGIPILAGSPNDLHKYLKSNDNL